MANNITNVLDVTGEEKDVEAFRSKVYRIEKATEKSWKHEIGDEYPVFDLDATVPFPTELTDTTSPPQNDEEKKLQAELTKKYGAGNWYDWRVKYWGTKWDTYDAEEVEEIKGGLRFRFETAWCPPAQWLKTTAKQFPSLKFTDHWCDEGGDCGTMSVTSLKSV
jgi:hypothetical protein